MGGVIAGAGMQPMGDATGMSANGAYTEASSDMPF